MARKNSQSNEPLSLEEMKEQEIKSYLNLDRHAGFGAPTYSFSIGDSVNVGCLPNCVVESITDIDGCVVYGITYDNGYIYQPWYKVRPICSVPDHPDFSEDNDVKIVFYNISLESLLNEFYLAGVDMNPPYQRDYVWEDADKEALLDSIFAHIEIGKFAFIKKDYSSSNLYEILDGKQRLSTLLDFYENRFPYKGVYFNDLSVRDKRTIMNTNVSVGKTENLPLEEIYKYFYKLNRCGKVMDEEHLEYIRSLMKKIA